jgi:hypothetical protein
MSSSAISQTPERKRRGAGRAGAWWLLDSAGAVAVALALAIIVGRRAEGHHALVWVLLLLAGGALRAFAVAAPASAGKSPPMRKNEWCDRISTARSFRQGCNAHALSARTYTSPWTRSM